MEHRKARHAPLARGQAGRRRNTAKSLGGELSPWTGADEHHAAGAPVVPACGGEKQVVQFAGEFPTLERSRNLASRCGVQPADRREIVLLEDGNREQLTAALGRLPSRDRDGRNGVNSLYQFGHCNVPRRAERAKKKREPLRASAVQTL